jgi:mycothiol synthase
MSYRWGSLSVADCPQWSELGRVIAEYDATDEVYSAEDLAEELEDPSVDLGLDTVSVRTEAGELVGIGQLWVQSELVEGRARAICSGAVHPEHRAHGLGWEMLRRQENRARAMLMGQYPGVSGEIRGQSGLRVDSQRRLLVSRGYVEARFFHEMRRTGPSPAPGVSPGLRAYVESDSEAVRQAHGDAFAGHWGSVIPDAGAWKINYAGSRTFRAAHSFVCVRAGAIEGYALVYSYRQDEIWIGQLGVRADRRGAGLGRALLVSAIRSVAAVGIERVGLGVDTDNDCGAGPLYASLGFEVVNTSVACLKSL